MALIVAPLPDYDSLASLAEADAYWLANTAWTTASAPAREAALRRGTTYILARRIINAGLSPLVVRPVRDATCEAALRDLLNVLYRDVDPAAVLQKTVGPITVRYAEPGNRGQLRFAIIDALLRGWTLSDEPVYLERA